MTISIYIGCLRAFQVPLDDNLGANGCFAGGKQETFSHPTTVQLVRETIIGCDESVEQKGFIAPHKLLGDVVARFLHPSILNAKIVPETNQSEPTNHLTGRSGGFLAFEGLSGPPAETVEWTPGPEDQWLMDAKFQADKATAASQGSPRALSITRFFDVAMNQY